MSLPVPPIPDPAATITDHSVRQVKTLLYNLAEGTRQHAQIDSITKQVARQYHGRTVIELLQNAHDALRHGTPVGPRRITFQLVEEGDYGALYVANDGRPLRPRDARALAEIGLSAKEPATDVGNKGLGFRSVLHVTDRPAVYSCSTEGGGALDGHCLEFTPSVLDHVTRAAEAALAGRPAAFLGVPDLLADWSEQQRVALRRRGREEGERWLHDELQRLSPYALPVQAAPTPRAATLAANGFSTVVHLPLLSDAAREAIEVELGELMASDDLGLFLESLRHLEVSVDAFPDDDEGTRWTLDRSESEPEGANAEREVKLSREEGGKATTRTASVRTFSAWSRTVGSTPEEARRLQAAAAELPDDWSRIMSATVDVAVEHVSEAPEGRYSIFLPTDQPTGTGAFINAPFYGEIDRRAVDFDHAYNEILRQAAVDLSAEVALSLTESGTSTGMPEAGHVLDLVAPTTETPSSAAPLVLAAIEQQTGDAAAEVPLVRAAHGWEPPRRIRVADLDADRCPIDAESLSELAGFAQPAERLEGRTHRVRMLLTACDVDPKPTLAERADLVEAVALGLAPGADWDAFWEWARALCGGSLTPLRSKRVLLVENGRCLALDGDVKVFFPPQPRAAADVPVPDALSDHVAFLAVPLRQKNVQSNPATRARRALADFESDLAYDPPTLVRRVLLPALPALPTPLDSPEGHRCTAVLRWVLRLYADRADWSDLSRLPVPCRGGWQPANKAMLGPGWDGLGEDLETYLSEAAASDTATPFAQKALDRLVVPPDHPVWEGDPLGDELQRIGVAEGLRLVRTDRTLSLTLGRGITRLSGGNSLVSWTTVRETLRKSAQEAREFVGRFEYETDALWALPGLKAFEQLTPTAREALSRIIIGSVDGWERRARARRIGIREPSTWRNAHFGRSDNQPHRFSVPSPLALALQTLPWLTDGDRTAPPADWWVLPPEWAEGQARHRYAYLHPVPHAPKSEPGRRALRALGAKVFLPDSDEPPPAADTARFLDAVADAAADGTATLPDLRSHSRKGWSAMPADADAWPERLLAEVGESVRAWTPGASTPCDLPPSSPAQAEALRAVGHPLLVIDPADAGRLADAFAEEYGDGVRRADTLRSLALVDGEEWNGHGEPLGEVTLDWVPHVVLAAHAFAGTQTSGTSTTTFAGAHAALRTAQVAFVENLATQIDLGTSRTTPAPTDAWWDEPSRTLLVRRDAPARALARPLGRLVRRRDLFYPLESALSILDVSGLSAAEPPTADQLSQVYAALGVDEDRRRDVVHATSEEAAWLRQRVLPVLALGGTDLDTVDLPPDQEGILALLRQFGPPGADPVTVLHLCEEARSDADLGRRLFHETGVTLADWNGALARTGRPPVANERGPGDTARALGELHPLVRAALRHDALLQGDPIRYTVGAAIIAGTTVAPETARTTWGPAFDLAAAALAAALAESAPDVSAMLGEAPSADALLEALEARGADPSDPETLLQENRRTARAAADGLLRVWSAFRVANKRPLPDPTVLEQALGAALDADALLEHWDPVAARQAIARQASPSVDSDPVLRAACTDLDHAALLDALDLTAADVEAAQSALDARQDEERRQRRTVPIAGVPFYAEDINALWNHLSTHLADDALPRVDLTRLTSLTPQQPDNKVGTKGRGGAPSSRSPQWRRDLTGLAGEILAYRALRKTYGANVVTPVAWKSENRALAHGRRPGDADPTANDALGYDFEFVVDGVTHQVEVKASEGNRLAFEMGESETRAARAAAHDPATEYLIVRVADALSTTPQLFVLPNPYLPTSASLFDVQSRGAVVYFCPADE